MPRVAHQPTKTNAHNPLLTSGPNTHPNVLKRNQACHQCRRRKLKCDAKRPCSTCVRSHAYAVSHATPDTVLPAEPECTFDETSESPKSKYEKLESRISELEALLQQKENDPDDSYQTGGTSFNNGGTNAPSSVDVSQMNTDLGGVLPTLTEPDGGLELIWPKWPSSLPKPELLRHLVEVFFMFHPHANRLFHFPTFLHSLSLSPIHPRFPALPVLHAICAVGSLYTPSVTSPPVDFSTVPADEIFLERHMSKEQRLDSFAETHAKLAKESADRLNSLGEGLFQVLQANILLTWFYWSHGRWVDCFFSSAHTMRLTVPMGLNMCPPFHSISKTEKPPSILIPAKSVVEDEMRRNAFWLAFATERLLGLGNGWALSLDDQDVSQLLPLRGDQFILGTRVPPVERQWSQAPDLLLLHHDDQVDSFILYIKGSILISRVKLFNLRFRSKYFAGDPSVAVTHIRDDTSRDHPVDPRGSAAFIELDFVASALHGSFPTRFRNPISDNVVDHHLYTTCLMPLVAIVVLHDPHAEVRSTGCLSALKILTAARAILDLIYAVQSTSYDITLLDPFCSFAWFVCGRVLIRFLGVAINASSTQISTLRTEVDYIHSAIAKVGKRIPLACRYATMLQDLLEKHCGMSPRQPVERTVPQPLDVLVLQTLFESSSRVKEAGRLPLPDILNEPGSFLSLG